MNIKISDNSNPLEFFKSHASQFPILRTISSKVPTITASSVPSEQLFSKAGEIITYKRNRWKPNLAEFLTILDQDLI